MVIKLFLLSAVAVTFIVTFCAALDIPNVTPALCGLTKLVTEVECTQCNFLTFGQDEVVPGILGYVCPNSNLEEKYCCYKPTRQPFCCDQKTYLITGLIWVVAVVAVIAIIAKFIKYIIS